MKTLTLSQLQKQAKKLNLTFIGPYTNNKVPTKYKCPKHGIITKSSTSAAMGKGCYQCGQIKKAKSHTKSLRQLRKEAKRLNLTFVGPYLLNNTATKYKCPIHGMILKHPASVYNGDGCGKCAKHGYNPNGPSHFYLIETSSFIGYGISSHIEERLSAHKNSLKEVITNVWTLKSKSGSKTAELEKLIKTKLVSFHTSVNTLGFKTEALRLEAKRPLLKVVSQFETKTQKLKKHHLN